MPRRKISDLKGREKKALQLARSIERREKAKKKAFSLTAHIGRYLKLKKSAKKQN
jgi:hypothetical protein